MLMYNQTPINDFLSFNYYRFFLSQIGMNR